MFLSKIKLAKAFIVPGHGSRDTITSADCTIEIHEGVVILGGSLVIPMHALSWGHMEETVSEQTPESSGTVHEPEGLDEPVKRPAARAKPRTKLTEEKVQEIRVKHALGTQSVQGLAHDYGVSEQTITQVVNRVTWKHVV